MKKALITGHYGPCLAELLLKKGYEVHGMLTDTDLKLAEQEQRANG